WQGLARSGDTFGGKFVQVPQAVNVAEAGCCEVGAKDAGLPSRSPNGTLLVRKGPRSGLWRNGVVLCIAIFILRCIKKQVINVIYPARWCTREAQVPAIPEIAGPIFRGRTVRFRVPSSMKDDPYARDRQFRGVEIQAEAAGHR